MKIGIIREGKVPPDHRVPLSPQQCKEIKVKYPNVELVVQSSPIRKFRDEEYEAQGITIQESVADCDILLGVKEVPIDQLIPSKTYMFFSHTLKLQPYNAKLLRALLDKKIKLIDYEAIRNPLGKRLIGFGRYAGIVGCYNGLRAFGLKHNLYSLKPAHQCADRKEMEGEMKHIKLPTNTKIVMTGFGRVGHGAREIIKLLNINEVDSHSFLNLEYNEPVFTHLGTGDYNARISDGGFDKSQFYKNPENYKSTFPRFTEVADMYVACHFWGDGSPFLYTREDMKSDQWKTSVVADISCDIDGPVASTIRPSTIADPIYGYDRFSEKEIDFKNENAVCVMAVDNLPCELPRDASEDFGEELIDKVLPHLLGNDELGIIDKATETTLEGKLNSHFEYLKEYANS